MQWPHTGKLQLYIRVQQLRRLGCSRLPHSRTGTSAKAHTQWPGEGELQLYCSAQQLSRLNCSS
jgi:hypothetical protein